MSELIPEPKPRRTLRPTANLVPRCWPDQRRASSIEVLGWEDGAYRVRVIGENGDPLNNGAVIGVNLADGATDAQIKTAVESALKRTP